MPRLLEVCRSSGEAQRLQGFPELRPSRNNSYGVPWSAEHLGSWTASLSMRALTLRGSLGSGCRSTPSAWTEESSSGPRRRPARCQSQRRRWPIRSKAFF